MSCPVRAARYILDWSIDHGIGVFIRAICSCKIGSFVGIHEATYNCSICLAITLASISAMLFGITQLIEDTQIIRALLIISAILSAPIDICIIISILANASLDRHRESRLNETTVNGIRRSLGLTTHPRSRGRIARRKMKNREQDQEESSNLVEEDEEDEQEVEDDEEEDEEEEEDGEDGDEEENKKGNKDPIRRLKTVRREIMGEV